jgi:S-(hydroxymethyl)glutathione dehydrogenase/alcohol dehydrogenase
MEDHMMQMRAAVLRRPGMPVAVEDVELAPPRAGEVLVKVAAAGVCHSDVRLADGELGDGRWPMVLGHEGAGVVEAVGADVTHVVPGDPVALCFVPACRECRFCRAGRPNLCEPAGANSAKGMLMDGTSRLRDGSGEVLQHGLMTACFAEYAVVSRGGAVKLPQGLPLWQAALLGCGVVTGLGAVRNVAGVKPGESVAVFGCGGVGLQVVAGARIAGAATIVAVDLVPEKLTLARAQGATHAVNAAEERPVSVIRKLTDGGVDTAFEVIGHPDTIRLAWGSIRPGGTVVVVGLAPRGVEASVPAIEFLADKSLRGTFYGSGDPMAELPGLAELALSGELDLAGVITEVVPLSDVQAALDRLRRGEGARTVLAIDPALAGLDA